MTYNSSIVKNKNDNKTHDLTFFKKLYLTSQKAKESLTLLLTLTISEQRIYIQVIVLG